ncbi:hypothetical protein L873DRAFT_272313 [Choiromyces venosus 120613-1]|uniref:Uncharacterized protein n=1 Tax=Choiromyces venosus 120613-1 TaxID=1336337 RepID=A0A3N4JXH2_9PEZI|nr:hypothetical protein L873DRAFT_272313 [Choiromyces venosus 120613-1]
MIVALDNEIGIIINANYDVINDGKNQDFCIIWKARSSTTEYLQKWWCTFSRCEAVGVRGMGLKNITIKDYNNLKHAIRSEFLLITGVEWDGIKVSFYSCVFIGKWVIGV